jgi:hypothetical protein
MFTYVYADPLPYTTALLLHTCCDVGYIALLQAFSVEEHIHLTKATRTFRDFAAVMQRSLWRLLGDGYTGLKGEVIKPQQKL